MAVDPITLEVLQNCFDVIADEMELTLLRTSFSPIVKEAQDASAALFTTKGDVIAQAAAIPIHLGCLVPAVKRLIEVFPVETMEDGDAYIMNDPYDGERICRIPRSCSRSCRETSWSLSRPR